MRHLRSIGYAIVLAPTVWVLCGAGFTRDPGFVPLLLAGAAYAILLLAPISPAGPLLAGTIFLGTGVWALAAPSSYAALWPPAGARVDLAAPGYGLAALLAIPLLATAVITRRWVVYAPAPAPVIGTVHGARGTARAAGVPVEVLETAIIPRVVEPDAAVAEPATEPTPTVTLEAEQVDEPTETFAAGPGTPTFVVSSSGEITTTDMDAVPVPAEAAEPEPVTEAAPAEAAVAAAETDRPEEPAEAESVAEPVGGAERNTEAEPTVEVSSSTEPEEVTAVQPVAEPEEVAETGPVAEAEPVAEPEPAAEPERVAELEPVAEAEPAAEPEPAEEEPTAAVPFATTEREEERTQVIELLIAARPTEDLSGRLIKRPNGLVGESDTTQVIGPRKPAAAMDHGEQTQVIKLPVADAEQTQVVRLPARTAPPDSETTQVVRLSAAMRISPFDGETTQVIRVGTEMPEAPGERTQVLPIPVPTADHIAGERTAEHRIPIRSADDEAPAEQHNAAPTSIVDAERPNPAEDPTTRLRVPKPDDDSGDNTTVDVRPSRRIMTVLNLERPQDEVAEDTRHLVRPPLPKQRHPDDEEPTP